MNDEATQSRKGLTRREFLRAGSAGVGAIALAWVEAACKGGPRTPLAAGPTATSAGEPTAEPTATTARLATRLPATPDATGTAEVVTKTPPAELPVVGQEAVPTAAGTEWTGMSEAEINEVLDVWERGILTVGPEARFVGFDELAGLGQNGIDYPDPGSRPSMSYFGVMLGETVVGGRLVIYVGFEDKFGKQFSVPFSGCPVTGQCNTIIGKRKRDRVGGSTGDKFGFIPVENLDQVLPRLDYRVASLGISIGQPPTEIDLDALSQSPGMVSDLEYQRPTALELALAMYQIGVERKPVEEVKSSLPLIGMRPGQISDARALPRIVQMDFRPQDVPDDIMDKVNWLN